MVESARRASAIAGLLAAAAGCGPGPPLSVTPASSPAPSAAATPAPPSPGGGPWHTLAVYTEAEGEAAARAAEPLGLARRVAAACQDVECAGAVAVLGQEGALTAKLAVTWDLPPPEFTFPSGGAAEADVKRLEGMPRVVMVGIDGSRGSPRAALAAVFLSARSLAREIDGLVFDPETLKLWRPEDLPVPPLRGPLDPAAYLSLGILPVGEGHRIVTFGLARHGAPDLVVEGVPAAHLRVAAAVVRAAAVRLAASPGAAEMALTREEVRDAAGEDIVVPPAPPLPEARAAEALRLRLRAVDRRPSDPDNTLRALGSEPAGTAAPGEDWSRWLSAP